MAKIAFVNKPKPGTATIEVPAEVAKDIEDAYAYLREHDGQEATADFDTADERNEWLRQVRYYCQTREAGVLKFRQLPSKTMPGEMIRFQITADVPANGAAKGSKK